MNLPPASWPNYSTALLALVVWREARGEGYRGMVAVAYSILNRVTHPKWWGTDLGEVLARAWQYSSLTDPKDPQLTRLPRSRNDDGFQAAIQAVNDVITGIAQNPVPGADSYYDSSIAPPKWATQDKFVATLGRLSFFNLDGDRERR